MLESEPGDGRAELPIHIATFPHATQSPCWLFPRPMVRESLPQRGETQDRKLGSGLHVAPLCYFSTKAGAQT